MNLGCWLFLKDSESIWVERPQKHRLLLAGPGPYREQRDFISDAALEAFQMALAERLAAEGWFLWGINRERRKMPERRVAPRKTKDRRASAAGAGG